MNIKKIVTEFRTHIIVWLVFIFYETFVIGLFLEDFGKLGAYVIHYILNILLFYIHAHILLTAFFNRRQFIWLLPLGVIVEVFLYLIVLYTVDSISSFYPSIFGEAEISLTRTYILRSVWRALYFIGFSTGYYFLITYLKEKEHTVALEKQRLNQIIHQQEIEQELSKAQHAYLRAQINPHFLFNTLNFIYNRSRKTAPIAADAILTLSAMMRYAIETGGERGDILIEDEIEQVNNLVHLHKLRQNEQIYFEIEVDERVKRMRVIPLVLITLVENIFKHGNLSLPHHPARLSITIKDNTLHIHTDNLINAIHNASGFSKGLENIGLRLDHAYGKAASFSYETDSRNHFKTDVKVGLEAINAYPYLTTAY